ncbi:EF-hand calcium-binding domain-containing protein 3 [Rhinatrema bivittatum]|uniref:EF-hand calcium-binding domain-containing protein 3 n=1 Tax=Rhinatrema bivittatum TaxID=194408 RepID=UPI00112E3C69|nr:EF-hand calcium-binding domain-containing protein 3 [Rhinatrema bivittatum]
MEDEPEVVQDQPEEEEKEEFISEELEGEKQVLDEDVPQKTSEALILETTKLVPQKSVGSAVNLVLALSPRQTAAFQDAFENFRRSRKEQIDKDDLQYTLHNMSIRLNHRDTFEVLKSADADKDGKLSFTDFITTLTDDHRFSLFMESKRQHRRALSNSEILDIILFDAMQHMVTKKFLPGRSVAEIVCYYQKKYKEALTVKPRRKEPKYGNFFPTYRTQEEKPPLIMGVSEKRILKFQKKLEDEEAGKENSDLELVDASEDFLE